MSIANNLFQDLTIDRQMLKRVQHDEMMEEEGKESVSSACSVCSVIKESENSKFKIQGSKKADSIAIRLRSIWFFALKKI